MAIEVANALEIVIELAKAAAKFAETEAQREHFEDAIKTIEALNSIGTI